MRSLRPILLLSLVFPAAAEKADLPPEALTRTATHVVVGEVVAVYTRVSTEGRWRVTRYLAEVKAAKVEKGEGIAPGDLVYVRYWTRTWRGAGVPPPSTNGHRGIPAEGETHRIHLARNAYDGFTEENDDGGFNVIGANGFRRMP